MRAGLGMASFRAPNPGFCELEPGVCPVRNRGGERSTITWGTMFQSRNVPHIPPESYFILSIDLREVYEMRLHPRQLHFAVRNLRLA